MPAQRLTRALLSLLLLTVLARSFIVGAQYSVYSPMVIDTVITTGAVTIDVAPANATNTGQVIVTATIYNVARLYAWQLVVESSATVNMSATTEPNDSIFQGYDTIGLMGTPISNGVALGNCLLGAVTGASGNGVLAQIAFQVDWLPASFKINPDPRMSFLLDDELNEIPFTIAGG